MATVETSNLPPRLREMQREVEGYARGHGLAMQRQENVENIRRCGLTFYCQNTTDDDRDRNVGQMHSHEY